MDRSLFSAAEPLDDRSVFDLFSDAEFDGFVVYVPGGDDVQNGVADRFHDRDLLLRLPSGDLAVEDFAELSGDTIERIAAFPRSEEHTSELQSR